METFFFSHSPLHETSKVLTLEILIRIFVGLFWTYISQLRENIDYIWIHYIAASFRSSYYNIQNSDCVCFVVCQLLLHNQELSSQTWYTSTS